MTKNNINSKNGFTIIEVVLVLAIAGLIFLMVFVALPALQRSQRDTQRRDDMARFLSQLQQYQANNRNQVPGNTPTDWTTGFISPYLNAGGDTFADPDGTNYTVSKICLVSSDTACGTGSVGSPKTPDKTDFTWDADKHEIVVYKNARCEGEKVKYVKNAPNQVAIRYKLEGAGVYCSSL